MKRTALILCLAMTGCAATKPGQVTQGVLLGLSVASSAYAENVNASQRVAPGTEKPGDQFSVIAGVALVAALAIGILDRGPSSGIPWWQE